ncbi:expressed unknown protein [Seminavis robusta]|uniref:Uncharacterized protein n=1 Tax=Seminavis robusta TaxID=568900 RepID=A0A9N8DJR8_9STRA|nr:expressed unknown protein [Seminavis robusta]|eukprot:Sro124_g059830.1 n/a (340) ;mRNA; r:37475-38599
MTAALRRWLAVLLLLVISHPSCATVVGAIGRGGSLQSRRWERMDGKALGGGGGSLQTTLQSAAGGRACSWFVWDGPSALLHRWCHHLLKDCVYEGLGGKKFVRIEPGSVLQLLYPCSRYSSDRCMICGGTYRDHLTLWWAKQLYTPLDQYLDKTYQRAVVLETHSSSSSSHSHKRSSPRRTRPSGSTLGGRRRRSTVGKPKPAPTTISPTKVFAFHRHYVTDVNTLTEGIKNKKERRQKLRKELTKMSHKAGPMEVRILAENKVTYVVPSPLDQSPSTNKHNDKPSSASATDDDNKQRKSALWMFSRSLVLGAMDRMIMMQEMENDKIRLKEQTQRCCP